MRRHEVVSGLATLALALSLGSEAKAEPYPGTPAGPAAIAVASDSLPDFDLRLARAAAEMQAGDAWGVIRHLEPLDFTSLAGRPDADRAAFLLAQAYRSVGALARFDSLARVTLAWHRDSPWLGCLHWQRTLDQIQRTGAFPEPTPDDGLGSLRESLARLAASDSTASDEAAGLASRWDTTTAIGVELTGALSIRAAAIDAESGRDPRPALARVPASSRHAPRAAQLAAEYAIEHGDAATGRATLESLLLEDSLATHRREILVELAALSMDSGRWREAESLYAAADRNWSDERAELGDRLAHRRYEDLWIAWENGAWPGTLVFEGAIVDREAKRLTLSASTPNAAPMESPISAMPESGLPSRSPWIVAPPVLEAWNRVASASAHLDESRADVARLGERISAERARLARAADYLDGGRHQLTHEDSLLAGRGARLDSLRARLDAWDAQLRDVRDAAIRRVVARCRALLDECESQSVAIAGMRHLHLEGPHRDRPIVAPFGYPSPDTLVAVEASLAETIEGIARRIETEAPETIRRSYTEAWRPGLIDRVAKLGDDARASLGWAHRMESRIDSAEVALRSSPALESLERALARASQSRDSLALAFAALRDEVAGRAVAAALAGLDAEREGLDYGLAASSYAATVGLGDSTLASTSLAGTPDEDPLALASRRQAIERLQQFLAAHPQSAARAELRFRLADLTLIHARGEFRTRMAGYVKRQSAGEDAGALPLLNDGGALDLYRAILREDPDFAHLDAVRFNAGMILADAGDPEAEKMFLDLVKLEPRSAYAQETWVRLGDMRFGAQRFREAGDFYAQAAGGGDATLRAVATYKLGWTAFRDERFADAARSFRDVLDLYLADRAEIHADIEREAESYLVQALTRAGGAEAYALLFEQGSRPYEHRILLSLAQQFRRYERHADAIAADRMALERLPLGADALLSARRMIDTYARWNEPAQSRDALLQLAPRFAPGSAWQQAQTSDSVRAAGAEFARRSWLTLAAWHQQEARARDAGAEWRLALELYETVLAHFPDDADAARHHLLAAEDAARLERYPVALAHAAAASGASEDSIRTVADWQQVAIADEWYNRRRNGRRESFEPNVDSLGAQVLAVADRYLERHPEDPRGADLMWREGQLAFAHTWFERAGDDFERLARVYPSDARIPEAQALRADAQFQRGRFAEAGAAWEQALAAAQHAGNDTLAKRAAIAIPVCYYRDAEAAVAADSTAYLDHAARFEKVATGWPGYEHADLAQYRAGRAYLKAGAWDQAVRAMSALVEHFPASEYARDAQLETARALEQQGKRVDAAGVLAGFAAHFPADSSAADAMLHAADLFDGAGRGGDADSMRLVYVKKFPQDTETAMAVYEALARRELKNLAAGQSIAALLPPVPVAKSAGLAAGKARAAAPKSGAKAVVKSAATNPSTSAATPASYLARYLDLARQHPELASQSLIAEVRFRQADESKAAAAAIELTLPLDRSLKRRQALLDETIARYRECTAVGVTEWSNASAYRIGQTLIEFGEALEKSQRPADLKGDDLLAYEDVLLDRAQGFYDRGEVVWRDLLHERGVTTSKDDWVLQARTGLWQRLGLRFAYRPETEYPLIAARSPDRPRAAKVDGKGKTKRGAKRNAARANATNLAGDTP